jgi:glutamate/aspartate transport system substrate-binding protein
VGRGNGGPCARIGNRWLAGLAGRSQQGHAPVAPIYSNRPDACLFLRHSPAKRSLNVVAAVRNFMQVSRRCLWARLDRALRSGRFFVSNCGLRLEKEGIFMKRALLALMVTAALGALSSTASAQDGPVMKRIAETKTVTIGHRDASVPLSYLGPEGKAQGYSIDICLKIVDAAKEELKLDKIDVKFVPLSPQTRIPLLTAGTVDIICESSTHTIGRSRQISFLNTTFLTGSKLLVRKTSGIKKIEDLTDKVLVAVLGTTNEKAAQAEIDAKKIKIKGEIVKVKDHSQAMLNLEQGRADAYVSDDVVLYGLKSASKNPDEWEIVGPYFSYDPYGMMIPRNNDDFRLLGNKTIAKLIQSGEMNAIYKKWFEPGPTNINYPMSDRLKENFQLIALPD